MTSSYVLVMSFYIRERLVALVISKRTEKISNYSQFTPERVLWHL